MEGVDTVFPGRYRHAGGRRAWGSSIGSMRCPASGADGLRRRGIDLFAQNPFWTVKGLAESLGVAFAIAQRMVDRLESAGIVTRTGEAKRNRVYCARAMLEILEAPLHLDIARTARGRGRRARTSR